MTRYRSRSHPQRVNYYRNQPGGVVYTETAAAAIDQSYDDLGKSTDHPLDLVQRSWDEEDTDYHKSVYSDVRLWGKLIHGRSMEVSTSADVDPSYNNPPIARILASSGPLKPTTYLPVAIFELRDLPRMLKQAGDLLHKLITRPTGLARPKRIATEYLAYQFGWKPLIQDILGLADFADQVAKKQRELQELAAGRSLRRTVELGRFSKTYSGSTTIHSTGSFVLNSNWQEVISWHDWATVRWQLRNPAAVGLQPTWQNAFRIAYGLHPTQIPVNVWKALPWSWAIDWFAGISDLIIACQNSVLFKPTRLNVMQTVTAQCKYQGIPSPNGIGVGFPGGTANYSRKRRWQPSLGASSLVNLRIPFLDAFKLSIISALTITRLSR